MSDLQLQQQIDELKSRHQDELKKLHQSHNDEQIALSKEFADKLQYEIKDKADSLKLFVTDDKDKNPQQRRDAIAQIQANFEQKKKFLDQQKQERKEKIIGDYEKKKDDLKKKQDEELRKLKELKKPQDTKDPKGPKGPKGRGRGGKKPNNAEDGKAYWEYHILTWTVEREVTQNMGTPKNPGCFLFTPTSWENYRTYGRTKEQIIAEIGEYNKKHEEDQHGTWAWKEAVIFIHQYYSNPSTHGWYASRPYGMWYLNNKGVMTYAWIQHSNLPKRMINMAELRNIAMNLARNKIPIDWHVKSPISNLMKGLESYNKLDDDLFEGCNFEQSLGETQITSRRFDGQPGGNGNSNGNGNGDGDGDGEDKKKKKEKKYKLYEFKYDIVITSDDGSVLKDPNKRIGLHESELKIYVQDGPFGTSWYEDITSYTHLPKEAKITYLKKEFISKDAIASRRLVMMGLNQVKDVKIENVRKIKTLPCDRIINEDLMKILPHTSKLMSAGQATLNSKIWSSFLVDKVFGGLLQEKDLYDIPELTKEHCINYVENIDMSSNPDYFDDLLKQSVDNSGTEKLSDKDNIYNKIVNANNNVLNLPARIVEKGKPVFSIPVSILFNFEMEADNDLTRFLAHLQQGAILAQKEMFGFITDFIVKTLIDDLPSLGNITQGVLIPIEEKSQKPQSQSYFVPTAPVATAVTAGMQIAAIETIAQGTITTITGGLISGNLLVVMASQVTALIVEFLGLPGLNIVAVAAGQAILATIKSLVYVLGEVIGKVAARIVTWTMIALLDIIIVGSAVIVTQALKKPLTISDYAFILGINYGKPPDLHFFGLNQTNESDSHKELTQAAEQFKANTGKTYDRVIGYAIAKDLKSQPVTNKQIGAVIDLTNSPKVVSGKELKMLYAVQFMYLFENIDEMQIPDRACVILPPIP